MRRWYPFALVLIALGASVAVYGRLPDRIPSHWGMSGEVNGYSSRAVGAFLVPGIMLLTALLVPLFPRIDPRGANYEKFLPTYYLVFGAVVTLLLLIHLAMLGVAIGMRIPMGRLAPIGAGALFVLLGNVLPRARPNWIFGIRTPWTLSNDRVWERTHRVGGYLMMAAGVIVILGGWLAPGNAMKFVVLGPVVATSLACVIYSYVAWTQETGS